MSTCLSCAGDGKVVTDDCAKCDGLGSIRSNRSFDVVVPPGVADGATMQLQGEGNIDRNRSSLALFFLIIYSFFFSIFSSVLHSGIRKVRFRVRVDVIFFITRNDESPLIWTRLRSPFVRELFCSIVFFPLVARFLFHTQPLFVLGGSTYKA